MADLEYSDRLTECRRVIAGMSCARCVDLEDGGLQVEFAAQRGQQLIGVVALFVIGVVGTAGGLSIRHWLPANMAPLFASKAMLISIMGILCVCLGGLLTIVHLVQGGAKPAMVEIRPGQLRADRWVCGDHLVSTWRASDLRAMWVEEGSVFAVRPAGEQPLIRSLAEDEARALGEFIARRLWADGVLSEEKVVRVNGVPIRSVWFFPAERCL